MWKGPFAFALPALLAAALGCSPGSGDDGADDGGSEGETSGGDDLLKACGEDLGIVFAPLELDYACATPLAEGAVCEAGGCSEVEVVWSRCWEATQTRASGSGLAVGGSFVAHDGVAVRPSILPIEPVESGFGRVSRGPLRVYARYGYDGEPLGCSGLPSLSPCGRTLASPAMDVVLWFEPLGDYGSGCDTGFEAGVIVGQNISDQGEMLRINTDTPEYEYEWDFEWSVTSSSVTLTSAGVHQAFDVMTGAMTYEATDLAHAAPAAGTAKSVVATEAGELRALTPSSNTVLATVDSVVGLAISDDGTGVVVAEAVDVGVSLRWLDDDIEGATVSVPASDPVLALALCSSGEAMLVGEDTLRLVTPEGLEWSAANPGFDSASCAAASSFIVYGESSGVRVDVVK